MLYIGIDTGGGWSTVHFLLDSIPYGTSATIRLKMIPNTIGQVLIGGIDIFNIDNKSCRYIRRYLIDLKSDSGSECICR